MMNPIQWIVIRRKKVRANVLAAPALSQIANERKTWKALANSSTSVYLQREQNSWVQKLRKAYKAITDAKNPEALKRVGIGTEYLEKVIRQGEGMAEESQKARSDHEELRQRLAEVDAKMISMYGVSGTIPKGAMKECHQTLADLRDLRSSIFYQKHQREFHLDLRTLEHELEHHLRWLKDMEWIRLQLDQSRNQMDLLLTSTAWDATKSATESANQAHRTLESAVRAWNVGRTGQAKELIAKTANHIETARKFCDRSWQQAHEEIKMWKAFLDRSSGYPVMKTAIAALPADLPQAELQKWIDWRSEAEREIGAAASKTTDLLGTLPYRSVTVLLWDEINNAAHIRFAQAVTKSCKETIDLLSNRQK